MDGATNDLEFDRAATLKRLAWFAAKRWVSGMADDLELHARSYSRRVDLRRIPSDSAAQPEWLWSQFCGHADSDGIGEDDMDALHPLFVAEAALLISYGN
jgi:hypothetical protein